MANLYDMYYAQAMNQHLAKSNDPDANLWADRVAQCFHRDSLLCAAYNTDIAGGKWKGMMTQKHIGYRSWNDNFPHEMLPRTTTMPVGSANEGGYTFTPNNGYISMEAEHFFKTEAPEGTSWTVYPYYGRTRSAVALTPYTEPVGDATLTYRFTLPDSNTSPLDSVKVHIIVKSTLDFLNVGGFEYTVSLNGSEPQVVNFNKTLVPVGKATKIQELTLHPRHPGIVFEKIVVDFGGYLPSYLFMDESNHTRTK